MVDMKRHDRERTHVRENEKGKKITERQLCWYGHVMRRDEEHILRKVLRTDMPGKGRQDDRKQHERMLTRLEQHWTESGRGDGQGDVE